MLSAHTVTFSQNEATTRATIEALTRTFFTLTECTFEENTSDDSSSVIYAVGVEPRSGVSSSITGGAFRRNRSKAGGNAFTLIFCSIEVTSVTFDGNMAAKQSANIYAIYSTMKFSASNFLNS